jgi:hypothetical protein
LSIIDPEYDTMKLVDIEIRGQKRFGQLKDRLHNPSNAELNHFCESYKMFFEHADQRFKDLAMEWKRQQMPMESHRPKQEAPKVGRNDPCPFGIGLKYKKCCGTKV